MPSLDRSNVGALGSGSMSGRTGREPFDISPGAGGSGSGADINPGRRASRARCGEEELIVPVIVARTRAAGITHSRGFR
jgi:hypothetical protein